VNAVAAFPVSGFEFPDPDIANEKKGFAGGVFAGANAFGRVLPESGAFAPPSGTPNSVEELAEPASFILDCPRLCKLALSLDLLPDGAGTAPLIAKLPGLPAPSNPNIEEGWIDGATAVLDVLVLEEVVAGCAGCTDEVIGVPKLNTGFGPLDATGATGTLNGEVLGGLFVPKLNFGFCESLMAPAGGGAKLGTLVAVVELEGCGNEKVPRAVALRPVP